MLKTAGSNFAFRIALCSIALAAGVLSGATASAQSLTPPQAAYLKLQFSRAEDQLVAKISVITTAPGPMVRRALPDRARITNPVVRIIASLEKDMRKPLSEEQKAAIQQAEDEYQDAIRRARAAAPGK